MKKMIIFAVVLSLVATAFAADRPTRTLALRWQRPAIEQKNPCGVTESELQEAMRTLTHSLKKSGMDVQLGYLKAGAASETAVTGLWINGKPLETWLNAQVVAEDGGCMTLKLSDQSYEKIPADVIVKAGMMAADAKPQASNKHQTSNDKVQTANLKLQTTK